jgi:hypothetical protein
MTGLLCASGCQSSSPAPAAGRPNYVQPGQDSAVSSEQVLPAGDSGARIEEINEALLIYVKANAQMPAVLDDLKSVYGSDLMLTAPSGKPYVYVPTGLTMPSSPKILVIYDPDELPNGRRWCILVSDLRTGSALVTEVLDLPEIVFRSYLASNP